MKRTAFDRLRRTSYLAAMLGAAWTAGSAHAVNYHYDSNGPVAGTGGTGVWDTASLLWRTPVDTDPTLVAWPAAGTDNDANFGGTAGTVTVSAPGVTANDVTFTTSGYIIQGSPLTLNGLLPTVSIGAGQTATIGSVVSGAAGLVKDGDGTIILTATNNYTGTTTVNDGVLQIGNGTNVGAINTSTNVVVNSDGTLRWFRNDNAELTPSNNHTGDGTIHYLGVNDSGANLTRSRFTLTGQNNAGFSGTIIAEKTRVNITQPDDIGTATLRVDAGGQFLLQTGTYANDVVINDATGWFEGAGNLSALRYAGTVNHSGDIVLNHTNQIINGDGSGKNSVITAYSASTVNLSGVLSGTGEFSMGRFTAWNGGSATDADIILTGSSSNTYTGKTVVDGQHARADLWLSKTGGAIAIQGGTVVQMGSATGGQANLRMGGNNQFGTNNGGVVMDFVNTAGNWMRFDLKGTTQTLAGMMAGTVSTQAGAVVQNQGIDGVVPAGDATLTLNGSGNYVFNGHLRDQDNSGTAVKLHLIKSGTGTQTFAGGSVHYTGTTTINNGDLELYNTNAFRSATTVNTGAELILTNSVNLGTGAGFTISLNNGGTLTHQGLTNSNDYFTVAGALTNSGNTTINQNSVTNLSGINKNLFLDGGLKGTGTVTINALNAGNAVVLRNNNSTFAGRIIVNGIASHLVNQGSGIGVGGASTAGSLNNADITLNGTMELLNQGIGWAGGAPGDFWMGALDGTGVMVANFTGGGQTRVRIGNSNNNGSFSGLIHDGTGNVIVLTKNGTGTQILSGANLYTGTTTVAGGTLLANNIAGSAFGSGQVIVLANATLGGTGSFSGAATINTNGILAPGTVGTIESLATGNLTFQNNAVYHWDYLAALADVTNVLGTLSFGANLTVIANSLDGENLMPGVEYVLFTYTGADPSTPNFNLQYSGYNGTQVRVDAANNRVVLSVITPEPATMSLLAFGGVALLRRRRTN